MAIAGGSFWRATLSTALRTEGLRKVQMHTVTAIRAADLESLALHSGNDHAFATSNRGDRRESI